ncbi:MAG: GNAT family N-acetyltransferase [Chloroflexi bacterium]|nr:GNAT family N-acetyltransferase [Chloroflexota bacterium]
MIYGKRIRFRAPEREDLPMYTKWINDSEVRAGLNMFLPMSLASEEKWFEQMLEKPAEEHPMSIDVQEGKSWKLIGNCGLMFFNQRARTAEVGIMIGEKDYWDQGYGTEAMQLILRHGFNTLNLNSITLRVYETNPRAIRSYEKTGFVLDGRIRQSHFAEGKYVDTLFMSVLRDEWKDPDQSN